MPPLPEGLAGAPETSSVLFLLGQGTQRGQGGPQGPCLLLNKRSERVRQAGDLCFPGGSVHRRVDLLLSRLLFLPGLPWGRVGRRDPWRRDRRQARRLALLLATGLREGLEEIRLNPFRVEFLGPLRPVPLEMFRRVIYPMVGWVFGSPRFRPNWEVERVVPVPVDELLDPSRYACYRVWFGRGLAGNSRGFCQEFPCLVHEDSAGREILWGATYRMVMAFLEVVLGFRPPPLEGLPVVEGKLGHAYVGGRESGWGEGLESRFFLDRRGDSGL